MGRFREIESTLNWGGVVGFALTCGWVSFLSLSAMRGSVNLWILGAVTVVIFLAILVLTLVMRGIIRRGRVEAERSSWRFCLECDQSLRGHDRVGRCPECGSEFHVSELESVWPDRWRFRMKRKMPRAVNYAIGGLVGGTVVLHVVMLVLRG